MPNYTHILWDWNGTLLDDVTWCIEKTNSMLGKRGLATLDTKEAYHAVFGFPVREYYRRVGFDFEKEPFEALAAEYNALYHSEESSACLFPEARGVLASFHQAGIHQIVLSASEQESLKSQIKPFDLERFLDELLGISNIYAASKIDVGKDYIERVKPEKAVLVGDTIHDKEVADALGVDCILVANGHQSREKLMKTDTMVIGCLMRVKALILNQDTHGRFT